MFKPTTHQTLDIQGTNHSHRKLAFWNFCGAVVLASVGLIFLSVGGGKFEFGALAFVAFMFSFIFAALAVSKYTYIYLDFASRQIVTVEHYA
jgi:hypothetical protein